MKNEKMSFVCPTIAGVKLTQNLPLQGILKRLGRNLSNIFDENLFYLFY